MKTKFTYACLTLAVSAAQSYAIRPAWVDETPPKAETYYYRMAQATAESEDKAYTKAMVAAVCANAFAADFPVDMQLLMRMQEDSAMVTLSQFANIPMSVVCRHAEKLLTTTGYKVYILCQVASNANVTPKYNTFNCKLSKEEK
jgi:environmental stress-induced protein Ves